jgi:hypothetical protein
LIFFDAGDSEAFDETSESQSTTTSFTIGLAVESEVECVLNESGRERLRRLSGRYQLRQTLRCGELYGLRGCVQYREQLVNYLTTFAFVWIHVLREASHKQNHRLSDFVLKRCCRWRSSQILLCTCTHTHTHQETNE